MFPTTFQENQAERQAFNTWAIGEHPDTNYSNLYFTVNIFLMD